MHLGLLVSAVAGAITCLASSSWSQSGSVPAAHSNTIIFEVSKPRPAAQRKAAAVVSGVFAPRNDSDGLAEEWIKDKLMHPRDVHELGEALHEVFEVACDKTRYGFEVSAREIERIGAKLRARGLSVAEVERAVKPLGRATNPGKFVSVVISESFVAGEKYIVEHPPSAEGISLTPLKRASALQLEEVRSEEPGLP